MKQPLEWKRALVCIALAIGLGNGTATAQTIESISHDALGVNQILTIRGSDFGPYNRIFSKVYFQSEGWSLFTETPYVWRDDFIQVKVPSYGHYQGNPNAIPIPKVQVSVVVSKPIFPPYPFASTSNPVPFQVLTTQELTTQVQPLPDMVQRTAISNNADISTVLGSPHFNLGRTSDAEFGDVDGDDYPDLIDNNSNNRGNGTHGVLRVNNQDGTFSAVRLEPVCPDDSCMVGLFATEVPSGGDFIGNSTTYDADLVDIDEDGFPDLIQTAADHSGLSSDHRLRVLMNNNGAPGVFLEDTAGRFPAGAFGTVGCPGDIAHADLNGSGHVDLVVTMRTAPAVCPGSTSNTRIFFNDGTGHFGAPIVIQAPDSQSVHDVFIFDANRDGLNDILIGSEATSGPESRLYVNDGAATPNFTLLSTFGFRTFAGESADLDIDGLADFVLAGDNEVRVYLNTSAIDGTFTSFSLPDAAIGSIYDVELGDINLDGATDIVVASITNDANDTTRIWLNDGAGGFTNVTTPGASAVLPGVAFNERLSSDLLDVDLDGDLELYLTGADGQNFCIDPNPFDGEPPLGCIPNQLWDNQQLQNACVPVPRGARAWFRFDELFSLVAGDSIAFNNGVYTNGTSSIVGKVDRARRFDGSNDHVVVADDPALDFGTSDFTIDFWMRTAPSPSIFHSLLNKRENDFFGPGYFVYMLYGRFGLQLADAGSWIGAETIGTVDDGAWHHVAVSVDRDTIGRFYIDGELDSTFDPTGIQGSVDSPYDLVIGKQRAFASYFAGDLDEIELHDQALAPSEIKALYRAQAGKCPCVQPPSRLAYWFPFDDQGTTITPSIVGRETATRINGTASVPGVDRQAAHFDGSNDYIEASSAHAFNIFGEDFTIAFWLETTQSMGTRVIQDKRSSSRGYHVFLSNGRVGFELRDGSGSSNYVSNTFVADGNAHAVAIAVDRDGTGRFYVDGNPAGTFDASVRQGSLITSAPLRFGRRSFGKAGWYAGLLDEFQLYKQLLSPSEAASLFSLGPCKEYTGNLP